MLIFHRLHLQSLHLVPWFPIQDQLCLPCGSSEEFPGCFWDTARIGECYGPIYIYHIISHIINIVSWYHMISLLHWGAIGRTMSCTWTSTAPRVSSLVSSSVATSSCGRSPMRSDPWSVSCVAMAWLGQAVGHRTLDISWSKVQDKVLWS